MRLNTGWASFPLPPLLFAQASLNPLCRPPWKSSAHFNLQELPLGGFQTY